jgi:hypothetical protein
MQSRATRALAYAAIFLSIGLSALQFTRASPGSIGENHGPHPMDYSLSEYAFLLLISILGGAVGFYGRLKAGLVGRFSFAHLIGEMATSAFAGLITFWLCKWAGAPELLTVSAVAIAGHMGARAITAIEVMMRQRFGVDHTPRRREGDEL